MYKTHRVPSTFRSSDVKKVKAVVARSTFPSQNVQSTPRSVHFWQLKRSKSLRRCGVKHNVQNIPGTEHSWKFRCRESVCRCGAKDTSKSKVIKTDRFGELLEVEMLKNCTPFWREAHFQVKMHKTHDVQSAFES